MSFYTWFNPTAFGIEKSYLGDVMSDREIVKQNETIIIINAKTAKLDIQLLQKMGRFTDVGAQCM